MTDDDDSATAPGPGPDSTAEVEPAAQVAPAAAGPRATKHWQKVTSVVLLVIGFILIPLSAVAIWSRNQLTNTDRYVETVSPLAANPDIQQTVATVVVNALFDQVNAQNRIESALPKRAKFLGAPLSNAMQGYATDVTERLLASDQFQALWDKANRIAHTQLVALLNDDAGKTKGALALKDGTVSLNLSEVVTKVQDRLVGAGLTFLKGVDVPPVSATINIIDSKGLSSARAYVSLLQTLAWVFPVLGFAALVGSALVVRTRRRATIRAAIVLVAACAFTLVLLAIARSLYLDAATSPNVSRAAASAVFDILVRNLRYGLITLGVVGIIVALVAYFVGPSAPAVKARSLATAGVAGVRRRAGDAGYPPNSFEVFVGRHRHGLELGVAGLAVLALVVWHAPGIGAVLFLAVVALALVGFIEFLARGAITETVEEQPVA
jgi:hypothetical protein